jgi:hypothetical protein
MPVEEITLLLFAACNSVRVIAYVPQILKAAKAAKAKPAMLENMAASAMIPAIASGW